MQEEKLVDKYLNHICEQENGSLEEFNKIISKTKLSLIEKKVKVYLA